MIRLDGDLPGLVISAPSCGHCRQEVSMEDGIAYCEGCGVYWGTIEEDETSQFDEDRDFVEVCGEPAPESNSYKYKGCAVTVAYYPCILPEGHSSRHLHPYDYESVPLWPSSEVSA
ncbi:hypothetical protein [Mycetocola saprophilus]|uniref:hypothetical protein n=1 Tax=Mycetocola saprophilus TaxID=76636 RepID=UPI0004C18BBE|nr:hypothetical protein [Mycetocola saprophilus]